MCGVHLWNVNTVLEAHSSSSDSLPVAFWDSNGVAGGGSNVQRVCKYIRYAVYERLMSVAMTTAHHGWTHP